jgi:hypothetical protein
MAGRGHLNRAVVRFQRREMLAGVLAAVMMRQGVRPHGRRMGGRER